MKAKQLLLIVYLLVLGTGHAQDKLIVLGTPNDLYLVHTVKEKESLSTIGRSYALTPRQIAAYNSINQNAVLPLGVKIKIPLSSDNLVQQQELDNSEPVYHIAGKGENLFRLSQRYYKVSTASLKKWNDLKSDAVKNGQAIIIGFIGGVNYAALNATASVNQKVFVKPPILTGYTKPAPLKDPNVMDATIDGSRELKGEMKPLSEADKYFLRKAEEKAKKEEEAAASVVPAPIPVTEFREKLQEPATEVSISEEDIRYTPKVNDEGYFGAIYATDDQSKERFTKKGESGLFKSLSGMSDRKFYVLLNGVLPGTIVRITAPNNKIVCARVLGALPEIKGSGNLIMRMSNATASALGMSEAIFSVSIIYAP